MKKFNKFLALCLAGASALTGGFMLAGCGKKDNITPPAQEEPVESGTVTQQKITTAKAVFADFKSQEDRLSLIGAGSSVTKEEGFVDNTFFSYQVNEEDIKEFTVLNSIYRNEYYTLDDYSIWVNLAEKLFEMDNFQFGTLYKMDVENDTISLAVKNSGSQIKLVVSATGMGDIDKWILNINYNSDNKATSFERLSEGEYSKSTFDLTSTRGLDGLISMWHDSDATNLQIYSERSGKYYDSGDVVGGVSSTTEENIISKISAVNLEMSAYDWDTYIQLDETTTETILGGLV